MRFDIYIHADVATKAALGAITTALSGIKKEISKMATVLDDVEREVAETNAGIDSAIVFILGIKAQLEAAGTDPVRLAALVTALDDKQAALAAAIVTEPPVELPVELPVE